jgi:hypothetical protein
MDSKLSILAKSGNFAQLGKAMGDVPCYMAIIQGRFIVVRIGERGNLPFYFSTGRGGKQVSANKWYPFFGIGGNGSGWFNKGSEELIQQYYFSDIAKKTCQYLDTVFSSPIATDRVLARSTERPGELNNCINVINKDMHPVNLPSSPQLAHNLALSMMVFQSDFSKLRSST